MHRKTYNDVDIDRQNGTVTKHYIQGDDVQRLRRMHTERDALLELHKYPHSCVLPEVLDDKDDGPSLTISYLNGAHDITELLEDNSMQHLVGPIMEAKTYLETVHHRTNSKYAVPESLVEKLETYSDVYADYIPDDVLRYLGYMQVPRMPVSNVHDDFKLANIMPIDGGGVGLVDWEHYSQGASDYDRATLFVNAAILLDSKGRLPEMRDLAPVIGEPSSELYFNMMVRTLVEFSPAVKRGEYGPSRPIVIFMQRLLQYELRAVSRPISVERFTEQMVYDAYIL
ncbi:hypothetical protein H6504_05030 [Candidatus Woesearchaeota archaeon]|nr:hypothetical protein [Candidatus Woesearchaeota archaeon]